MLNINPVKINYDVNPLSKPTGIRYKMSNLRSFSMENKDAVQYLTTFEWLYDKFAPKAFGFITGYTDTKEQAAEFITDVFLKVWADIKTFDKDAAMKIQHMLLMVCKPIFKNKQL